MMEGKEQEVVRRIVVDPPSLHVVLDLPALMQDRKYELFVRVCTSHTCLDTQSISVGKYIYYVVHEREIDGHRIK